MAYKTAVEEQLYHCFRCGMQDMESSDLDRDFPAMCPHCNEFSIVTLTQALDMLNDLYLKRDPKLLDILENNLEQQA